MHFRLRLLCLLLFAALPLAAQSGPLPGSMLFTPAQLRQAIQKLPNQPVAMTTLYKSAHYMVILSRVRGVVGVAEEHPGVTDLYDILNGHATLRIGGKLIAPHTLTPVEVQGTRSVGYKTVELKAGMLASVPPDTPHQLDTRGGSITMLVYKVW